MLRERSWRVIVGCDAVVVNDAPLKGVEDNPVDTFTFRPSLQHASGL